MVHVGEQKTPVTKRIYAPYDKKNQHNKCRHKERKHRDPSLHPALLTTCCCRFIAVHIIFLPRSLFLPSVIKQQIILQPPVIVQCFPTFLHRRKSAVRLSHTCCADHRVFLPKPGQTALQGRQRQITVLQHIHGQIIGTGLSVHLLLNVKVAPDHIRYFIF